VTEKSPIESLYHDVCIPFEELKSIAMARKFDGGWKILSTTKSLSIALYHFIETLGTAEGCSYNKIRRTCTDLNLIREIANLSKHAGTIGANPSITSIESLHPTLEIIEYVDESGDYQHSRIRLMLNISNGSTRDYLEILSNCINSIIDCLHAHSHPRLKEVSPPSTPDYVTRLEASTNLDLEGIKGFALNLGVEVKTYDSVNKKVNPKNLEGLKLEMRIYGPITTSPDSKEAGSSS
jgi:hypothetical protein